MRLSLGSNSGLTLTSPVKVAAGPAVAGRASLREISTPPPPSVVAGVDFHSPSGTAAASTAATDRILFMFHSS